MELNFAIDKNEDIMILKNHFNNQSIIEDIFFKLSSVFKNENIDKYYDELKPTLESKLIEIKQGWLGIEKEAINKIKEIFADIEIGKIDCIISINPSSPRYIKQKFFLVNFEAKWPNEIIIHELLHYYFFEYCFKNHKNIFQDIDIDNSWAWDLSEIFNFIVLNDVFWKNLLKIEEISYYEEHKEFLGEFEIIWKNRDLNEFILKGIEILKK